MKSIAIMQPTFLPWLGYFALIDRVDEFVFLDNVQFDKRSWQQRNKIKTPQGSVWLSVPVLSKGRSDQMICDVEILNEGNKNPFEKMIRTIEINYKKAPFFLEYAPSLFSLFEKETDQLASLNKKLIIFICEVCGLNHKFFNASALNANGKKDALLYDICLEREAKLYVSPPGSANYLDQSQCFKDGDIKVIYHEYNHPTYRQLYGDFVPYMCILDLLFNEGANTANIIRSGMEKI